jgi:hypothetical protein
MIDGNANDHGVHAWITVVEVAELILYRERPHESRALR